MMSSDWTSPDRIFGSAADIDKVYICIRLWHQNAKKSQSRLLILFFLFYFSDPENRLSTDKYLKPQNLFWVRSVKSWIRASLLQMQIALLVLFLM